MKKFILFFATLFIVASLFAQAPQLISYQAVIYGGNNNQPLKNKSVGMRISILQGSPTGTAVYVETHTTTTNSNGLVTIRIGGGTPQTGLFADIDWSTGVYFLKTETDPQGGTNYTITGSQQLLSVPYALFSQSSGSSIPGPQGPPGKDATILSLSTFQRDSIPAPPVGMLIYNNSTGCFNYYTGTGWIGLTGEPTLWYADGDGDGFGSTATSILYCNQPSGYVATGGDCDDTNADIYPTATETCDGVDEDCDGSIDENAGTIYYADIDGDGYGRTGTIFQIRACTQPAGFSTNRDDCDDSDENKNPGVTELCNGIDDNCNGYVDEGLDNDGDGYTSCGGDCDDNNPGINPSIEEVCNGIDDNCNGIVDDVTDNGTVYYADADGDGFGDELNQIKACSAPSGYVAIAGDCNDNAADINPDAAEVCNNIDDDCDGIMDEDLNFPSVPNAVYSCNNGMITFECDPGFGDCDNDPSNGCETLLASFYLDSDGDGFGDAATEIKACSAPDVNYVFDAGDCDDNNANFYPGAPEQCNGVDDNCDGVIDNNVVFPSTPNGFYTCSNGQLRFNCFSGFGDCDFNTANGCETNLLSSVNNCGACGRTCSSLPNAVSGCSNGVCVIVACNPGFADCDRNTANGCESNIVSGNSSCGSCGVVCPPGTACVNGKCETVCPPNTCKINGQCVTAGTTNPNASCQECNPSISTTNWSPKANGTLCSDGVACTTGDVCIDGVCEPAQENTCGTVIDEFGNPVNCGACGPGFICVNGECIAL